MRQLGICIPTYERAEMTIESFIDIYGDERVSEITIVDDASSTEQWIKLVDICSHFKKVSLSQNKINLDCYRNKKEAISKAKSEWCILLDSDNVINNAYINELSAIPVWNSSVIYTPSFAKPAFDFRNYEGIIINRKNVSQYIDKPMFEVCLNACNYFVNREEYLKVWDGSIDPVTSDSIYFMSKWFEAGNSLYIVPNLHYEHTVHNGHYEQNKNRTPQGFHESILNKLRELK